MGREPLRLHLGGREPADGWTIVNIQPGPGVDVVADISDLSRFEDESVDEVYASHVFEHLSMACVLPALRGVCRIIKPGGTFRIAVPDLARLALMLVDQHISTRDEWEISRRIFGGDLDKNDRHSCGFTPRTLLAALTQSGFVNVQHVESFNLFQDMSETAFLGHRISLNMEATKPMPRDMLTLPCNLDPRLLQSQLGQERFVIMALEGKTNGTFVDIGAGQPWFLSNTIALQGGLGWNGVLCDIEWQDALRKQRKPAFVFGDAFAVNWREMFEALAVDGRIDFLSLDLEPPELTEKMLDQLPLDAVRFSVACIEHDSYRGPDGPDRQDRMRRRMADLGYELITQIQHDDWWVDPAAVDVKRVVKTVMDHLGIKSEGA
jgi:predicted SAM-dependent methyltransferase